MKALTKAEIDFLTEEIAHACSYAIRNLPPDWLVGSTELDDFRGPIRDVLERYNLKAQERT